MLTNKVSTNRVFFYYTQVTANYKFCIPKPGCNAMNNADVAQNFHQTYKKLDEIGPI